MSDATVHINKVAASGRQLDAAIRMFFSHEDELAIHTVASAAFRVLRDVTNSRGRNFTVDVLRRGIVVLARDYANGTLPEATRKLIENTPLMGSIQEISDNIRAAGDGFDPTSIKMRGVSEQRAWPSKSANFLKHADRDPDELLAVSDLNNEHLLIGATVAYLQLIQATTPEMTAYLAYWSVKNDTEYDLSNEGRELASKLKQSNPGDWPSVSLDFINTNRSDGQRREMSASEAADRRERVIVLLEGAMELAEEIGDANTAYLIERAVDEARSQLFRLAKKLD